jgi:phosphoribosylformimino-5-aminoimidazole carboxamide ribotide isomerase
MRIYPAIDLRAGRCVRLVQGDYDRETAYSDDPGQIAAAFVTQGAEYLHVVDLDAARDGQPANLDAVMAIARAAGEVPVQLGGGMRTDTAVDAAFEAGVTRVIVGTAAVREESWFRQLVNRCPGRVVLGLDTKHGRVATNGWLAASNASALEIARRYSDLPLAALVFTDVSHDGLLAGPNLEATADLARAARIPVIASGGVGSLEDLRLLAELPLEGAIVGKALYEARFTLAEAIQAACPVARSRSGTTPSITTG